MVCCVLGAIMMSQLLVLYRFVKQHRTLLCGSFLVAAIGLTLVLTTTHDSSHRHETTDMEHVKRH